ncbi:MAG: tRNA (N6-isopentenyl adenosine(37)-C2)-methylthiotransferase MiaB [Deltaproteobacteria bacterium]|nr:tRNA (N6-isopentenyl adenosine(37)-C2)-methylthiotransferase MiaB [Deltaproteobacteria bacterium]
MKFYIKTFGCQMNVHDSRRIEEILSNAGHVATNEPGDAQIALVNSCTIRQKPWHKAISETGRLRKGKISGRDKQLLVGLVGCVAQQEGDNIFDLLSHVDFVVSPDNYSQLPGIIDNLLKEKTQIAVTGFSEGRAEDFLSIERVAQGEVTAFVTIMKGCQERCKYCIVPTVRGPERHRGAEQILHEIRNLVASGVKEITLLGQKVNAYQADGLRFSDLLKMIDEVAGLERLRFTSPHPRHMTPDVTDCFGQLRTLCEAIHLPVQSGSNATLKRMGRRYTREDYLAVVARLKQACPEISISTDLIIGYPGETEAEFEQTLSLIEEVGYSAAFSFKFSPRPFTPAGKLDDDVSEEEKSRRLANVHALVNQQEKSFRDNLRNSVLEVLVEGEGRMDRQLTGRARNYQIVNFVSAQSINEMVGKLVNVRVTEVHPNSLEGELV